MQTHVLGLTLAAIVALSLVALSPLPAHATQAPPPPTTAKGQMVDLNTASISELEGLPGIGRRTAERIVEHRQKHGPFKKIEELMNVQGIGEKSFLRLKPLIAVAPPRTEKAGGRQ